MSGTRSRPLPLRRAPNAVAALVVVSLLAPGCTTLHPAAYTSPVPETLRRTRSAVAVVPRPSPEQLTPVLAGEVGRGKGAAKGAARGAGAGALSGLFVSLGTGPLAIALAPILVPAGALLGAAGGTVIGAVSSVSEKEGDAVRKVLAQSQADLTAELARRVTERLPGLGKTVTGQDAMHPALRLEVSVDKWGLEGASGPNSMASFFLSASYRVSGDAAASDPSSREFTISGPRRRLSEWSAQDGVALRKALEDSLATAAEAVTESAFLIHDFHTYKGEWGPPFCGLAPLEPGVIMIPHHPLLAVVPRVDSVTPTLRWEPFPRKVDVASDTKGVLARVTRIRYDLRIWKSDLDGDPGDLIYARQGLALDPLGAADWPADPPTSSDDRQSSGRSSHPERFVAHRLEASLEPATTYLWTVRARFLLDGEERITRWSFHQYSYVGEASAGTQFLASFAMSPPPRSGCSFEVIPTHHHHRFRTP